MKKIKYTKTEQTARRFCDSVRKNGSAFLNVFWKKSRTWGMCPRAEWDGETLARATGSGYCKHSTVLAESLRWLADTDDARMAIWQTGGAGVRSVRDALRAAGWALTETGCSSAFDGYQIARINGGAP